MLKMSPDGSMFAAASFDHTISLYDFKLRALLDRSRHSHECKAIYFKQKCIIMYFSKAAIRHLVFTKSGNLISVSEKGRLSIFSIHTMTVVGSIRVFKKGCLGHS